jgi:hypothetical protein
MSDPYALDPEQLEADEQEIPPATWGDEAAGRHYDLSPDDLTEIPRQVDKYLKDDERNVVATRQHPSVLVLPALAFGGGLLAASLGNWALWQYATASPDVVHVIWLAWLAAAGWAVWKWLEWRAGWFVITAGRLITVQGLVRQRVDQLPYDKLRDLAMSQSIPGRLLGYGTFHCTSIATGHALETIDRIPDPDGLYRRVMELIMPAKGVWGPRS